MTLWFKEATLCCLVAYVSGFGEEDVSGFDEEDVSEFGEENVSGFGEENVSGFGEENVSGCSEEDGEEAVKGSKQKERAEFAAWCFPLVP